MAVALQTIAFVAVLVVGAAGLAWGFHLLVRPRDLTARSATALRELEPSGGRHRFHVRLMEVLVAACVAASGTGAALALAATTAPPAAPIVCGVAMLLLVLWFAWRRGSLREAARGEPRDG